MYNRPVNYNEIVLFIFLNFCFEMQCSFVVKKNFSYRSPETKQCCRIARLSDKDMGDFSARNQYFVVSAWLLIRLFETGVLDAEETVKRLKTEVLQDQWTFHTEKMLSFIRFIGCKEVRQEE